jgi:hypothetical protein
VNVISAATSQTSGSGADVWTKLTAVGTLLAVVAALLIAGLPVVIRWVRRPHLHAVVDRREPWTRWATAVGSGFDQLWLRMEVQNTGRTEAVQGHAVLREWYARPNGLSRWKKLDIDPAALHWVSAPHGTATKVDLPPKLNDFVDLVVFTIQTNTHQLVLAETWPRGFGTQPTHSNGEYVLTVTVVADNAKSITTYVHYELTRANGFDNVRLDDKPPADAEYTQPLGMMQQLQLRLRADSEAADETHESKDE